MRRTISIIFISTITLLSVFAGEKVVNKKKVKINKFGIQFKKLIATADRIVIRDGGFNCCRKIAEINKEKILLEIKDKKEVQKFNKQINFEYTKWHEESSECGYPGIDWYKGNKIIALTGVISGESLRWKGVGDQPFTEKTQKLIKAFLKSKKIEIK